MDSKNYNKVYGECRCCLTKGHHQDIMKEYYSNGSREVYYDIFMECFNLFLSTNTNLSTLICSSCVQRLRDANAFRTIVASTEQKLLQTLNDDQTVFINVGAHTLESEIKLEDAVEVKEELSDVEEYETMDYNNDPDYLPSDEQCDNENVEMLTKDPKNDMIKGEAQLLARFPHGALSNLPTRSTLYSSCTDFVMHLDSLKGKLITAKMIANLLDAAEHKKAIYNSKKLYVTEKMAHIVNVSTLLEFSNITPFKSKSRSGFPCFYCRNIFDNLSKLREHQRNAHKSADIKRILTTCGVECFVVYVDITDLKCNICNQNISNLNELKSHLTKLHKKKMHPEFTDRVIPFKLSDNQVFECQVCGFSFETFGSIERHMNVHYRNYVCKQCGNGFVTKYRLKVHTKSMHVEGNFPCEICKKVYTSQQKYKNHVDTVHKLVKRFKCPKCSERFSEYFRRQKHMVQSHGVAPLQYKCNVCEKSFDRRYTLSRHMKRDHLEERDYQCDICTYKCFTNNELRVHMVKHNGERIFECAVCKKSYARKKTLKEHMRIHNNDRRFACAVCGQAFVQKCSLKGHIKTHHLEYSLQ